MGKKEEEEGNGAEGEEGGGTVNESAMQPWGSIFSSINSEMKLYQCNRNSEAVTV